MRAVTFAVLLLAPASALAEPERWMKKARPNELALTVAVHPDCPREPARYERTVLRVFNRSRINRAALTLNEVYLRIQIWCGPGEGLHSFTVHGEFALITQDYAEPMSMGPGYDAAGAESDEGILRNVAYVARLALNDHIAANFDR